MRVHLIGNTCNHHFDLARNLRTHGVDAHLFLTPGDLAHPQTRPESSAPALKDGYPHWIHSMSMPWQRFRPLASIDRQSQKNLAACDLIHSYGNHATWIANAKTPYVIQPFGYDFLIAPFRRLQGPHKRRLIDYRHFGYAKRVRHAYRNSSAIILANLDLLWKKGYEALLPKQKVAVLGLIIDTEEFSPGSGDAPPLLADLKTRYDLVTFQASRHIWTERGRRAESGYSYGNDLFLRALAQAINDDGVSACAVMVDKPSHCVAASKALIGELGIEKHVVWIPPMPRHQLIHYYRNADLTVDAFYAGGFGSSALEALACGCPVLMYLHETKYSELFGEVAPVLNARSIAEIRAKLMRYAGARGELAAIGAESVGYVKRYHSKDAVIPRYRQLYQSILDKRVDYPFVSPSAFLGLRAPLPAPGERSAPRL